MLFIFCNRIISFLHASYCVAFLEISNSTHIYPEHLQLASTKHIFNHSLQGQEKYLTLIF